MCLRLQQKNTLLYGTITNIGGSLTVYKTLFEANTGAKVSDVYSMSVFISGCNGLTLSYS
jgi:hypothetical protein